MLDNGLNFFPDLCKTATTESLQRRLENLEVVLVDPEALASMTQAANMLSAAMGGIEHSDKDEVLVRMHMMKDAIVAELKTRGIHEEAPTIN